MSIVPRSGQRRFRARVYSSGGLCLLSGVFLCAVSSGQETLYNGIRLSAEWPPRDYEVTGEPAAPPPYLMSPPRVIPINLGRQLFTDDFLIEDTTLRRVFHSAKYYPENPVLKPDKPWERKGLSATAMVYSDGVWYDSSARLYKMWYRGENGTAYATSLDGIHWVKPELDVRPGTNIVLPQRIGSSTTWLDLDERDPEKRYKTVFSKGHLKPLSLYVSADGIHWKQAVSDSPPAADRTTVFWNPFRKVWVVSLRDHTEGTIKLVHGQGRKLPGHEVRYRRYFEAPDLISALSWKAEILLPWVGADRLDPSRLELNVRPELYNLDAVAYESLLVGLFSIWRGQPDGRGKPNDLVLGFSRDGFHWERPFRKPFIPVSERKDDWNWSNIQSAGGGFLVVGDRLFFYVSGRTGASGELRSTGLATLRRDGFASMQAGDSEGVLTTRPLTFRGSHLFVNVDSVAGAMTVEVLDEMGRVIQPFSRANSVPVRVDSTMHEIRWKGDSDLSKLAGRVVKLRFHVRNGQLYSFWISTNRSGASNGYVAAGGPGFTRPIDTVGYAAYQNCCATEVNH